MTASKNKNKNAGLFADILVMLIREIRHVQERVFNIEQALSKKKKKK